MNNVRREHRLSGRYSDRPGRDARAVTKPSAPRLLAQLERLDDIADLDVVVAVDGQTTLEALADLGRVVLEPLQRRQLGVVDDHRTVPDQPDLRVAAEQAAGHPATGDVAHLRGAEDLPDLRLAKGDLLVDRLEHALQGGLDVVDRRVDDRVVPDIDVLALGQLAGVALGPDVEAEDDGVGGGRQRDVVLRDRAHAAVDDPQRDLGVDLDLQQRVLDRLDRTADVALEDEVELGLLPLLEALEQRLEGRATTALRKSSGPLACLPLLGDLPGRAVLGDDKEVVAGTGNAGESEHLHGLRRTGLGDVLAALVEHGAHTTVSVAGDDRVTDPQRAAGDEHGRNRTAALVEPRLDGNALRVGRGVGEQLERRVRGEQDRVEELLEAKTGLRRHVDEHGGAAVLLGDQAVLGQLTTDLGRVGAFLVDLVDRNHDRHLGGLRVVERLDRLRLHAVVRSNDEHDDVGHLRTAGAHGREGLVTRGVDEGDLADAALDRVVHLVGADVLRDAAGLALEDVRLPDGVEQPGLSVVDVTHDRDDRGPRHEDLV